MSSVGVAQMYCLLHRLIEDGQIEKCFFVLLPVMKMPGGTLKVLSWEYISMDKKYFGLVMTLVVCVIFKSGPSIIVQQNKRK